MNRSILFICLGLIAHPVVKAQLGGQEVFRVLEIPSSARLAALGGTHIALMDDVVTTGSTMEALARCRGQAGAARIEDLEAILATAGFTRIAIQPKDQSREFIRDWAPGRGVEDLSLIHI